MKRILVLALLAAVVAPTAQAVTAVAPAPGKKVNDPRPMFRWQLAPGETNGGVYIEEDSCAGLGRNIIPKGTATEVRADRRLPAGKYCWYAFAKVPDAAPSDTEGSGDGSGDEDAAFDYVFSHNRSFRIPSRVANVKGWDRFDYYQQNLTFTVRYWTNDPETTVRVQVLGARTGRTYFGEDSIVGSTPYAKNQRKFEWYVGDQLVCKEPLRVRVTVGARAFGYRQSFSCR